MSALQTIAVPKPVPESPKEWPSFHGCAVPERQDSYELGYDFVRAVHHRLTQPLTALRCTLEVMHLLYQKEERALEKITQAIEQSDRAMHLMGAFRSLFEADCQAPGEKSVTSVNDVLSAIVDDLRPVAEDRGVQLGFSPELAALKILGNPLQLRQALWNLVQNCVELTAAGKYVCVTTELDYRNAVIVVADGLRATSVEIERTFDPFSYCSNSAVEGGKVSNLPLAIMQRTILAVGGEVRVSSDGSHRRFVITLPVCSPLASTIG